MTAARRRGRPRAVADLPTIDQVQKVLAYDPCTGALTWKVDRRHPISAGDRVRMGKNGYGTVNIGGASHLAHRVAWLLYYGEWPTGDLDHKNRDRGDNSIDNLRLATAQQNARNRARKVRGASGFKGVYASGKRWRALISTVNGSSDYIGTFDTPEEAARAYNEAAIERHGVFAALNEGVCKRLSCGRVLNYGTKTT